MSSVFDASAQADIRSAMKAVFDSFKRNEKVRFYKIQEEEIIMFASDYNSDFKELELSNSSVSRDSQYEEFDARVIYLDRQDGGTFIGGGEELNIKTRQFYGRIKIQIEEDGYNYIKDAERITFDNCKYQIEDDIRKVGAANEFQFYTITLSKLP